MSFKTLSERAEKSGIADLERENIELRKQLEQKTIWANATIDLIIKERDRYAMDLSMIQTIGDDMGEFEGGVYASILRGVSGLKFQLADMTQQRDEAIRKMDLMKRHGAKEILDYPDSDLLEWWPACCVSRKPCGWRGLSNKVVFVPGDMRCPACGGLAGEDAFVTKNFRKVREEAGK